MVATELWAGLRWLLLFYTYLGCLLYLVSMLVLKSLVESCQRFGFGVQAWSQREYLELLPKYWARTSSPLNWHKPKTVPSLSKKLLQIHTSSHSLGLLGWTVSRLDESGTTRLYHFPAVIQNVCAVSELEFILMKGSNADGAVLACPLLFWFWSQLTGDDLRQLHSYWTYCCLKYECEISDWRHIAKLIIINRVNYY